MKKIIRSFGYAFKGLRYAFLTQLNFRIHVGATILAVFLGVLLNITLYEWLWVLLSITAVMLVELLNTSIETLTDLVSPQYNEKAGHVKDISAAAVLITAIFAFITGTVVFLPKIYTYLP